MSPPGGASGEHSTFIHVAPSLPVDGLKVALGVKVRADTEVTGSKSYGWGIFDVFRHNLPQPPPDHRRNRRYSRSDCRCGPLAEAGAVILLKGYDAKLDN